MSYDTYAQLMHWIFLRIADHVILWTFVLIALVAIVTIRGRDF